jgi:hypothetical protein
VKLRRAGSNNVLGTATTDANGIATLPNVPADVNVYLDFDLPTGYAFTLKDQGSNNESTVMRIVETDILHRLRPTGAVI